MDSEYLAALYCRLSKDDLSDGDSSSIVTQKLILETFCKTNGFNIYDFYVDDGYSGTNFDRPAFERMINDVDCGKINMIITKDLSRLGRDYIMMGYYTDIYFASNNIRYIAINDNYDSVNTNNDIAPFKNILNDMYARDLSRKVKNSKLSRAKQGYYIGTMAPYGYILDHNNKQHFKIDDRAAAVVRLIFELAANGYGSSKIASYLKSNRIICPAEYKFQNGIYHFTNCTSRKSDKYKWNTSTILNILSNRAYIGEMICHKTETINYKTKQKFKIPKSKQFITYNSHQPIIDTRLFEKVQAEKTKRYDKNKFVSDNIFKGIVKCSVCGCNMTLGHRENGKAYYRCMYSYRHPEKEKHTNSILQDVIIKCVKKNLTMISKLYKKINIININTNSSLDAEQIEKYIDVIIVCPKKRKNTKQESRVQINVK